MCYEIDSMMIQTSKRAKNAGFVWRRLVDVRSEYSPLKLKEKPSLMVLRMICDMNRDDDAVRENLVNLEKYENDMRLVQGERISEYIQKRMAFQQYQGSVFVGRAYTSSPLNWFPRRIINTLYKTSHVELDIVNATPSLLLSVFRHVRMSALWCYVNEPEAIMEGFKREHGISRVEVKKAVLATIGALPSRSYDYGQSGNIESARVFADHPFMTSLRADLQTMLEELRHVYSDFYEAVRSKASTDGKLEHVDGMALTLLAQDVEHAVMRCVFERVEPEIWYYDGAIIPQSALRGKTYEEFCEEMSDYVSDKLDVHVNFKIKDLIQNSIAYSLSAEEARSGNKYELWKREFEKEFALFKNPPRFGRFYDGMTYFVDKQGFSHLTSHQPADMMKQWMADPTKRAYEMVEFAPPPMLTKGRNFNTWNGFAAEKMLPILDVGEMEERIKPYQRHVHLLMGQKDEYAEYFHQLMAYKLQYPGYNWGVMPFIRSTQGVGKDQWFKFITSIVGSQYCLSVTSVSDIMGKSTGLMENKLFVTFSEACYEDSKRHEEELKKLITDDRMVVERKYVPSYENRMTACLLAFSNNFGAFRITNEDRRYFPVTASGMYANDPEYHMPFNAYIQDEKNQRAVFQWLTNMNIDGFQPMTKRPITETFMEMSEQNLQPFDIFLTKNFEDLYQQAIRFPSSDLSMNEEEYLHVKAKLMWDSFEATLQELKYQGYDSRTKVEKYGCRLMAEFISRAERFKSKPTVAVIAKERRNYGIRYSLDVKAIKKYLQFTTGSE